MCLLALLSELDARREVCFALRAGRLRDLLLLALRALSDLFLGVMLGPRSKLPVARECLLGLRLRGLRPGLSSAALPAINDRVNGDISWRSKSCLTAVVTPA